MARKAFSIHSDFYEELRNLTPAERGDVLLALINWAEDMEPPQLEPESAILFRLMRAQIERISKVNSNNGTQGGAPPGNQNAKKSSETSEESENNPIKPPVTTSVPVPEAITNSPPLSPRKRKDKGTEGKQTKTQYADFVSMTNDEYTSLVAKLGEQGAVRCIEILDNYKGACGKKYASDYRAILNWVAKRYEEETARGGLQRQQSSPAETNNPFLRRLMEEGMEEGKV